MFYRSLLSLHLCGRRDSNPYALRHQILSLAWLPITTRPHIKDNNTPDKCFAAFSARLIPQYKCTAHKYSEKTDAMQADLSDTGLVRHIRYRFENLMQHQLSRLSDFPNSRPA